MENKINSDKLKVELFSVGEGFVMPSNKELEALVKPWKCSAIIHFISGTIVGGGPTVKYWGVENTLRRIAAENNINYALVSKSPIGDSLSGKTIMPEVLVSPSQNDWNYLYKFWGNTVKNVVEQTVKSGYQNILVFSEGYTAFVPLGVQNAFKTLPFESTPNIRMITRDSSLPDLPYNKWGGRFNPDAFSTSRKRDKLLESFFITNAGVPIAYKAYSKPEIKPRIPKGCTVIDTAFPFLDEDIKLIRNVDNWYVNQLTKCNDFMVKEILSKVNEGFTPISWLTNGEIFDKEANWMTKEQKESSYKALRKLVISTAQLSERKDQKIVLILPGEAINDAQTYLNSYQRIKNIKISTYPYRSPNLTRKTIIAFDYLVGTKGILVGRTAQTNAIYQALLMPKTRVCVLTAPSVGYMNTTTTDPLFTNVGIPVETAESQSSKIYNMLERTLNTFNPNPLSELIKNNSFYECVSILCGLKTDKII